MLLWTLGCMYLFKLVFLFFWAVYSGVELLGHMVVLFLVFLRNPHTGFHSNWLCQFTFPQTVYKVSLFYTSSPAFVICRLIDDSHSDRCEVISPCGFDLHFPDDLAMSSIFSCACWPSACLLWKNVYLVLLHIFKSGCWGKSVCKWYDWQGINIQHI